jgi:hypothetical protein
MRSRDARIACEFGNILVGALAWADSLTLLAPTAYAAHKKLYICDQYGLTYSISFNAEQMYIISTR